MSTLALDPDLITALRTDLTYAAYTVGAVETVLGPVAAGALRREMLVPAHRQLIGRSDPLAVVIRLFALGDSVDHAEVAAALPTLGVAGAQRLGLVVAEGDALRATCEVVPHASEQRTWWVASDLSEMVTRGPLRQDHVLGVGGASTTLATWTPRPHAGRAADIGTGCGVQALHLGEHADEVVVTDLSERALAYARFNAALNGAQWEVRGGSLLEPLAGERFDLIVSNPPFVITPRGAGVPTYEYRDGGAQGDAVVGHLVRHLGDHLEPGGIAQLLGNWEVTDSADWRERVHGWLAGTGLDAWVIQRDVQDPAEYAETWARDGGHRVGTADFERMYRAWLDDFETRGVRQIGFGIITLQRPAQEREPFVDLMEVTGAVASPMGPHILAGLKARTWLAQSDDDAVLDVAWRAAADVTEERHTRVGEHEPSVILIRQGGGLGRVFQVDTVGAALFSVCDGELTARQALAAIAGLLDLDTADATRDALPLLRDAIANGLLVR